MNFIDIDNAVIEKSSTFFEICILFLLMKKSCCTYSSKHKNLNISSLLDPQSNIKRTTLQNLNLITILPQFLHFPNIHRLCSLYIFTQSNRLLFPIFLLTSFLPISLPLPTRNLYLIQALNQRNQHILRRTHQLQYLFAPLILLNNLLLLLPYIISKYNITIASINITLPRLTYTICFLFILI